MVNIKLTPPVARRLEREVEARERLDGGELGDPQRHLRAAVLARRQFLGEVSMTSSALASPRSSWRTV